MPAAELPLPQDLHTLYRDHHGWLYGLLRRKLRSVPDAADIAHDTYVRVMVSGRVPQPSDSRRYLAQIANGLVIDHWRRQDIERAYLDAIAHLPEPEVPSPEARLLIMESLMSIDAMLRGLPAFTRQVFLMAQLDDLTLAQIAEQTDTPVITVRRHIRKALLACVSAV
jgi:RNA polymerase sigma-70 factor (ECF subfamily)